MTNNKRKQARQGQTISVRHKASKMASSDSDRIGLTDIKKLSVDIKKSWKHIAKNRYKIIPLRKGPYKSDRWIWNGAMLLVFFFLWIIAYKADYNLDYFKCGDGERLYIGVQQTCPNPFYNPANDWKCHEELGFGEYGTKPSSLFNNAGIVSMAILILAGLLNHIIHNRRRRT